MRPTLPRSSGGAQFPYPKEVWSPAGGWWTRPSNWRGNTIYVAIGVGLATWGIWSYSADKEVRHAAPTRQIPSMLWAKQFTSGEMGVKDESALKGSTEGGHH